MNGIITLVILIFFFNLIFKAIKDTKKQTQKPTQKLSDNEKFSEENNLNNIRGFENKSQQKMKDGFWDTFLNGINNAQQKMQEKVSASSQDLKYIDNTTSNQTKMPENFSKTYYQDSNQAKMPENFSQTHYQDNKEKIIAPKNINSNLYKDEFDERKNEFYAGINDYLDVSNYLNPNNNNKDK